MLIMMGMSFIQEEKKSNTEMRKNADLENCNNMKEGACFHHLKEGMFFFILI